MSVDDINPLNQYQAAQLYHHNSVHTAHDSHNTAQTTGAASSSEAYAAAPASSYSVPGGTTPTKTPLDIENQTYAAQMFNQYVISPMSGSQGIFDNMSFSNSILQELLDLGMTLARTALEWGMKHNIYTLDGRAGITDTHSAESMGIDEFVNADGTFDKASALAETQLIREGERSAEDTEKEASYFDYLRSDKNAAANPENIARFEQLAAQGAVSRASRDIPGFADSFASSPQQTIQTHLPTLTHHLLNTAITNSNGQIRAFF